MYRVQVDANKTHQASREYNATLNEYLYGKICYSATPPPGTVGAEESNPGLPSVSEPGGCMPCTSAMATSCCIRGEELEQRIPKHFRAALEGRGQCIITAS